MATRKSHTGVLLESSSGRLLGMEAWLLRTQKERDGERMEGGDLSYSRKKFGNERQKKKFKTHKTLSL